MSQDSESLMTCPGCDTLLEPFQVECHACGQITQEMEIPYVAQAQPQELELEMSCRDWISKGKMALKMGSLNEAQACFAEAVLRVKGLSNSAKLEVEARKRLAYVCEKSDKKQEAIEQYMALECLTFDKEQKVRFQQRVDALNLAIETRLRESQNFSEFRELASRESRSVPLYCKACKRLLNESEVYEYRRMRSMAGTCVCGFKGTPLARKRPRKATVDMVAIEEHARQRKKRKTLIEAAAKPREGGRDRTTAIILAVTLGGFGAHKFYLGETLQGYAHVAFCWTLIPILLSWIDAVQLFHMSRVSFNLMYNVEAIIASIPFEAEPKAEEIDHSEVFSMELSDDDPDDFLDEYSSLDCDDGIEATRTRTAITQAQIDQIKEVPVKDAKSEAAKVEALRAEAGLTNPSESDSSGEEKAQASSSGDEEATSKTQAEEAAACEAEPDANEPAKSGTNSAPAKSKSKTKKSSETAKPKKHT